MQTIYCVVTRKIFGISLFTCGSLGANEMIKFILEEGSVVNKNYLCQQERQLTLDERFDKRRGGHIFVDILVKRMQTFPK